MKNDDETLRRTAEAVEVLADLVSDIHPPDEHGDCDIGRFAREVRTAARDVQTEIASKSSPGPAQVATAQYRVNYESIFGVKNEVGLA